MSDMLPPTGSDAAATRRGRGWFALVPLALFGALALLFVKGLGGNDPSRVPSPLIGRPIPEFSLAPLEGLKGPDGPVPGFASGDLKTGEVTLVNVWASWCVPCRDEHPWLAELAENRGARLVGINYKDDPENARRFLGSLGSPFLAVGVDPNGRTGIDWGVYGVPETFVVDGKGIIRFKQIGPILTQKTLDKVLAEVAKAQQPLP